MTDIVDVIKLELTTAETNVVLGALGKAPYEQVSGTVEKIIEQGRPQAQVIEEAKAAAAAAEEAAAADAAG